VEIKGEYVCFLDSLNIAEKIDQSALLRRVMLPVFANVLLGRPVQRPVQRNRQSKESSSIPSTMLRIDLSIGRKSVRCTISTLTLSRRQNFSFYDATRCASRKISLARDSAANLSRDKISSGSSFGSFRARAVQGIQTFPCRERRACTRIFLRLFRSPLSPLSVRSQERRHERLD